MAQNNIKPSEISDILLGQLRNVDTSLQGEEVGSVLQVSDGVVRIHGLASCEAGELLEFESGEMAVAMNLEEDNVGAILLGRTDKIAEGMKDSVPCTACRYCCEGCPAELDIPALIAEYNDMKVQMSFTPVMRLESLPAEKMPHACLQCGACMHVCPQGIAIPDILADLAARFDAAPKWADICEKRNKNQ